MSGEKNIIVAVLLSLIVGMGNVYVGLVKRGLFEFIVGILFIVLTFTSSVFFSVVFGIWLIFVLYDTYLCCRAVNEDEEIPKLLGQLKIE